MSIHWPIIRQMLLHPGRVAIVDDRGRYTNLQLLVAALHVAERVKRACETDTIGLLLPTGASFPIGMLAGWMLGKTVVPLNYLLKPEELQYVIDDCGTDTVISVGPMLDYLEQTPRAKTLIRMDEINFREIPEPRVPLPASPDRLAVLLYTSGTSGRPKGVMLTHANLRANVRQVQRFGCFTSKDVMLGVLPQFHSFGLTVLTLVPLTVGARLVCTARFVPHKLVRLMRKNKPTTFIGIPSMYNALLRVKDATAEDFASFRFIVSGGEPLPEAVSQGFRERFGVQINEGYGLTETAPCTNWCSPEEYVPHSVGKPLPDVVERIVDLESGVDLPAGMEGEIRISGPNVMRGYYNRPEETAGAFDERGFFRTGDIGKFDEAGNLYITGRLKEMMIIGGENVFPREIEEVLNAHADVHESGVVGMTDPVRGEIPVAYVELVEGAVFSETALIGHCRQHLAGYKVPRHVRVLDALPRNPTGKIMRRALRELPAPE